MDKYRWCGSIQHWKRVEVCTNNLKIGKCRHKKSGGCQISNKNGIQSTLPFSKVNSDAV